jgi:hypothetical protein
MENNTSFTVNNSMSTTYTSVDMDISQLNNNNSKINSATMATTISINYTSTVMGTSIVMGFILPPLDLSTIDFSILPPNITFVPLLYNNNNNLPTNNYFNSLRQYGNYSVPLLLYNKIMGPQISSLDIYYDINNNNYPINPNINHGPGINSYMQLIPNMGNFIRNTSNHSYYNSHNFMTTPTIALPNVSNFSAINGALNTPFGNYGPHINYGALDAHPTIFKNYNGQLINGFNYPSTVFQPILAQPTPVKIFLESNNSNSQNSGLSVPGIVKDLFYVLSLIHVK